MMKKVLVDAVHLLSPKTGIGKYTFENCIRMQNLASEKIQWYYNYGYIREQLIDVDNKETPDNKHRKIQRLKNLLTKSSLIKSAVKTLIDFCHRFSSVNYALYWQPNIIPGSVRAKKVVTTIHDLSFLVHPDWHPLERQKYMTDRIFEGIKRSDKIITGSYFIKEEIMKYAVCDSDKIAVIYHGIDHQTFRLYPQDELKDFKQLYYLPDRYLLFVGSIEPRKNLLRLLQAYKRYVESNQKALEMILVGFKGWQNDEIMQMIHSLSGKVRYLGYLNDQELAYVYNLATVFIYPSLYEGFGIPPLEAMACGTPVITSNATSIPEICGEAAVYIDPNDEIDIQQKIELLATREDMRNDFIQRGLKRSQGFTWEASARKHLGLFEELMSG
ncbi:glycosyltransferase family 1 protein [Desulfitobacterium sp. PCE1]|uniref:glycosyltransferase family 4 protein n=1 Tax=Desulfitobacterium sp. PCE1 TaxID=146907 RepID=UPI00036BFC5C|nr:glycosyltransferase family 1 protein [Desulfitobacterium sp. PCE1]